MNQLDAVRAFRSLAQDEQTRSRKAMLPPPMTKDPTAWNKHTANVSNLDAIAEFILRDCYGHAYRVIPNLHSFTIPKELMDWLTKMATEKLEKCCDCGKKFPAKELVNLPPGDGLFCPECAKKNSVPGRIY